MQPRVMIERLVALGYRAEVSPRTGDTYILHADGRVFLRRFKYGAWARPLCAADGFGPRMDNAKVYETWIAPILDRKAEGGAP